MANSNNWGEIYKSTWWGDKAWSANTLFIDSAPPGFGLNLLKASEDMDNTIDWDRLPDTTGTPTVSANVITDPNGGTTAERVDFSANSTARLQQRVTLEASKQYTFSVYAKVNTGTQNFRLRNVTLRDAEAKTATTSWTRFSYTFTTTTAGDYDLSLQNSGNTARTLEFWGAMLNEGATAGDYVKTDGSFSGSAPAPAYAGFGDAFGGVTAYYSLRQFTEAETLNAIRVRRSSDDTEQDIGFDANGDLDSTALTTFVNADVDTYTSDFSSGTDSFTEHSTTNAGNIDGVSDGTTSKDDVLRVTMTGGSTSHQIRKANIFDGANTYDISFEYYIPSANTKLDQIVFRTNVGGDGDTAFSNVGTWSTGSISDFTPSGTQVRFNATDGGSFIFDADGDVFYLKNIVVTQTTADGAVTTFYDQSGNGNNATNSTESEQPLVVSGGALVEENGKAAVDFDGVDDYFTLGGTNDAGMLGDISVFSVNKNLGTSDSVVVSAGLTGSSSASFMQWALTGNTSNQYIGTTSDGTTRINEDVTAANYGSQVLVSMINDEDGNLQLFADGVGSTGQTAVAPMNDANYPLEIGRDPFRSSYYFSGTQQELILFASDQSSNRTGMETNINDHFDIYTP